jgi:hypothetical protein
MKLNKHVRNPIRLSSLLLALTVLPAGLSAAPFQAPLKHKGWLQAGFFYPFFNTTARLDLSAADKGTSIDLEDDLGMESEISSASIRGAYYLSERWRLEAEYLNLDRSASKEISREIEWGDETFEAGASVRAFFDIQIARLAVGYDFYQNERAFLGFTVGAHLLDASAGIAAAAFVGDKIDLDDDVSTGGVLPVPNLGFYGSYLLSDRWRLDGRLDWFGIEVGEWDGTLITADLQLAYYLSESWSLAGGVQYFNIDVNYDNSTWRGGLEFQYIGPRLEISWRF